MRALFAFVLLSIALAVEAQSSGYALQTRRFSDAIWIRWNPVSQDLMKNHATRSYALYRTTISRDGKALEGEERFQLNREPIRWDTAASSLDTMKIIKELFFWKPSHTSNFQASQQNLEMQGLAYLQGNLWLMRDFNLALNCGLGWVDGTVKSNETYLYELRLWGDSSVTLESHYIGLSAEQAIPQFALYAEKEKRAMLRIEKEVDYWGYLIEKAYDVPADFKAISTLPFVNGTASAQLVLTDTQRISRGKVFYRISGVDVFGLQGPWSDTLSIELLPDLTCPEIQDLRMQGDSTMLFSWVLPDSILPFIKSHQIRYGSAPDDEFRRLLIQPSTGKHGWEAAWPAGFSSLYIWPSITDVNDKEYAGPMAFIQPVDSMPPPFPTWFQAVCDSVGIVSLHWRASPNARYYRLYRANYRNVEFTDHSHTYFSDTFYSDTLDLNTLQDTVYYAVTALDSRYNESGQSMFACAVFDKIPPPPPAFLGYELTEKGYMIRWTGSRDAASYNLHKLGGDLQTISTDSMFYLDSTGKSEEQYTYYLTAKDRNANVSEASAKLVLRFPLKSLIPAVPKPVCLNDTQNRKCYVMWEYPDLPNVSHFRIMLKSPGKSKTIATARSNERQYCMHGFLKSEEDEFEIIAYAKDGMKSR